MCPSIAPDGSDCHWSSLPNWLNIPPTDGKLADTCHGNSGGFLPVFWDVPKSEMHAVGDIGAMVEWLQDRLNFGAESTNNLAVLHNQTDMVRQFGKSAWVTQSGNTVI